MKHKRQTLSKTADEGDGKESPSSGGGSGKKSDKRIMLLQDENSKSCQNCDLSSTGGAEGIGDHPSGRVGSNNNNNTTSVTNNNNNNNTSFNNNSNASSGASSVASSISSSFDKMVTEEDSRSNESSGVMTSPGLVVKKLGVSDVMVKVEVGSKSPPLIPLGSSATGLGKLGGGNGKDVATGASGGVLGTTNSSGGMDTSVVPAPGSLTPSSTPGTPLQQQPSPLGVPPCGTNPAAGGSMMGGTGASAGLFPPQRSRSSPATTTTSAVATATATASVTAVLQQHASPTSAPMPPLIQIVRGSGPGNFPLQPGTVAPAGANEYRGPRRQHNLQNQGCYSPREIFQQQQRLVYPSEAANYLRQQHHASLTPPGNSAPPSSRLNGMHTPVTTPRTGALTQHHPRSGGPYHHTSTHQQQYHQQQTYGPPAVYNGYHQGQGHHASSEHSGYHPASNYPHRGMSNHPPYHQGQPYSSEHESYLGNPSNYGGYHEGMYSGNSSDGMHHPSHPHMSSSGSHQQMQGEHGPYYSEGMHHQQGTYGSQVSHHIGPEYGPSQNPNSKAHQQTPHAYYDHASHHQQQHMMHQGGDASNIPSNFVSSPDPFPMNNGGTPTPGAVTGGGGVTTMATAIAAATAAVMTPPTSVQTDSGDNFNSFHHFYSEPHQQNNPVSAENSNSSSDFNFLSNLANDFAPEYYQLS